MPTNLLIDEPPLLVLPKLAVLLGLTEAIILQQVHFWITIAGKQVQGDKWIFNRLEDWHQQFPFWSTRTIQRALLQLEKHGYIQSRTNSRMLPILKKEKSKLARPFHKDTKWYSIRYAKLNNTVQAIAIQHDKLAPPTCDKLSPQQHDKLAHLYTENTNTEKKHIEAGQKDVPVTSSEKVVMKSGMKGGPKKGSVKVSAAEVQAQVTENTDTATHQGLLDRYSAKKASTAVLASFWKRMIRLHHPEYGIIAEFKTKELGHFTQLRKYLKQDVLEAVAQVIENWVDFTKYAESNFGAYNSPMFPTLPYLIVNSQALISYKLLNDKENTLQPIASKEQKGHTIVKEGSNGIAKQSTPKDDKPMSLQEFMEIEEGT